jgi:sec-independent protein translocase protein TatA
MFGLGFQEILLILVIIFLLFGVKRLPDIGKGLGETMREIRKIRDERKTGKEKEKEKDEEKEKEKDNQNQKGNLISEIKKEIEEIPGLKEAKEIKEAADKLKNVTKFLK